MMEAILKLASLARAYNAHERTCHGYLMVSLPTLPFDGAERIELMCTRCATSVREIFSADEFRQLNDAGIVTDDDVRRFVATTACKADSPMAQLILLGLLVCAALLVGRMLGWKWPRI